MVCPMGLAFVGHMTMATCSGRLKSRAAHCVVTASVADCSPNPLGVPYMWRPRAQSAVLRGGHPERTHAVRQIHVIYYVDSMGYD